MKSNQIKEKTKIESEPNAWTRWLARIAETSLIIIMDRNDPTLVFAIPTREYSISGISGACTNLVSIRRNREPE